MKTVSRDQAIVLAGEIMVQLMGVCKEIDIIGGLKQGLKEVTEIELEVTPFVPLALQNAINQTFERKVLMLPKEQAQLEFIYEGVKVSIKKQERMAA